MNRRERVAAALRGAAVDHVPISFWAHNFATENSAEGLAGETLALFERLDWDYLKPQTRAQCFAEAWGLEYAASNERAVPYRRLRAPVADAEGLGRLRPADPLSGALGEQLEALRAIRSAVGPDVPIIWTVFAPLMVAPYLLEGERPQLAEIMRQEPAALARGLAAVAETLDGYARAAIEFGADGLFYATNVATVDFLSPEACRRFQRPYDLPVLEAASSGWFTMLHLCGDGVLFDEFLDYPFDCLSWGAGGSNPELSELQRRMGRAVVGGLPGKPAIAELTETQAADLALGAIHELDGRSLLLGPGCSINPDTPERVLIAARDAARGAAG